MKPSGTEHTGPDADEAPPPEGEPGAPVECELGECEKGECEPAKGEPEPAAGEPALTEREREILAFERKWWRHPGAKEQAIRDTFELPATRYYQILNGLLDNPAALAHDPVLVGRLRRLRGSRDRTGRTG